MPQSVRDEKTSGYINTSEANLLETTSIAKNDLSQGVLESGTVSPDEVGPVV
jgi:hypothetical protein